MRSIFLNYICCANCKSSFNVFKKNLKCRVCKKNYTLNCNYLKLIRKISASLDISKEKWNEVYKNIYLKNFLGEEKIYLKDHFGSIWRQINESKKIKDIVFLEIGCGPMFFGQNIAKNCKLVIGLDISEEALKIAQKMFELKKIKNYLLIQGDIQNMPIKDNTIDLIYGGGVIEHFEDTQIAVNEIYRVLKPGGISFNTVPCLNLGALIYRQIWGNIPNFPILKQIAEFIHIKIFRGKYMRFGYELSFLPSTMINIHKRAGFKKVKIDKFDTKLVFEYFPKFFRPHLEKIANSSKLFWPMIKVIAEK